MGDGPPAALGRPPRAAVGGQAGVPPRLFRDPLPALPLLPRGDPALPDGARD